MKDYFQLLKTFGHGESACMIYCREHRDVLGSSNLKDIKDYCLQNGITFLTTLDFLYYAFCRKKLSAEECLSLIHISEPTRLGMISYAVFCLKKKKKKKNKKKTTNKQTKTKKKKTNEIIKHRSK